jgi:chitinase
MASWSYDHRSHEMISFDSEQVAAWKARWIVHNGLGGAMFWELSGDKGTPRHDMEHGHGKDEQPGRSLVSIVRHEMGHLDNTPNNLAYPGSCFDNLRSGL